MRAPGSPLARGCGGLQWAALLLSAVAGFVLGPEVERRVMPGVAALAARVPPPGLTRLGVAPQPWPSWRELGDRLLAGAQRAAVPIAGGGAAFRPAGVGSGVRSASESPRQQEGPWRAEGDARQPTVAATAAVPDVGPEAPADRQTPQRIGPPGPSRLGRPAVRVAIYHTHTSEMYRRPDFQPDRPEAYHRFGSTDTGVVRVGRALAEALNELGIPTLHVSTIHDYPDHGAAYARSERTVRMLLERYPDLVLLLDIHRDAPQEDGGLMTSVDGEDAARVALVVGTGPDGTEGAFNLAMARRLAASADRQFPGLMRRLIAVAGRRYNQHLHPGVLLVEVGSYRTWEAAALRTARFLALVVADVVMELVAGDTPMRPGRHMPSSPSKAPGARTVRGG